MSGLWICGILGGLLALVAAVFSARIPTGSTTKRGLAVTAFFGIMVVVLSAAMYCLQAKPDTSASCEATGSCTRTSASVSILASASASTSPSATVSAYASPSASASAPSASSSPGVNYSAAKTLYLYDTSPVMNRSDVSKESDITIGQETYLKSLALTTSYTIDYGRDAEIEFNIPAGYEALTGTVGLTNQSPSECKVKATVEIDGVTVFDEELSFGQVAQLNVPLGDGLRVKLLAYQMEKTSSNCYTGFGSIAFV